jgi:hypothetical protein
MRSCNKNKMREVIAAAGWMRPHACIVCWRFARVAVCVQAQGRHEALSCLRRLIYPPIRFHKKKRKSNPSAEFPPNPLDRHVQLTSAGLHLVK